MADALFAYLPFRSRKPAELACRRSNSMIDLGLKSILVIDKQLIVQR